MSKLEWRTVSGKANALRTVLFNEERGKIENFKHDKVHKRCTSSTIAVTALPLMWSSFSGIVPKVKSFALKLFSVVPEMENPAISRRYEIEKGARWIGPWLIESVPVCVTGMRYRASTRPLVIHKRSGKMNNHLHGLWRECGVGKSQRISDKLLAKARLMEQQTVHQRWEGRQWEYKLLLVLPIARWSKMKDESAALEIVIVD